jgi:hypothetical protein
MKLNVVLSTVLKNLGIDITDPEAQKLIGNSNLATIEVGDSVSTKLTAEYFTKEAALQDPGIRSQIRAEALNGIDAQTKELMTSYEFDAETMAEILKEDKTSKKLSKMVEKVAELTKTKAKAGSADKDVLSKKIEELNGQIATVRSTYETKLAEEQKGRKTDRINWELDNIYNGLDYSLQADKEISVTASKAVIAGLAAKRGLRFETTESGIQILTKDGTEHYENNIKVTPADFIKKSLMENKMLKVSDTPAQPAAGAPSRPTFTNTSHQHNDWNTAIDSAINALPQPQRQ